MLINKSNSIIVLLYTVDGKWNHVPNGGACIVDIQIMFFGFTAYHMENDITKLFHCDGKYSFSSLYWEHYCFWQSLLEEEERETVDFVGAIL